jgi:hypothetical protein
MFLSAKTDRKLEEAWMMVKSGAISALASWYNCPKARADLIVRFFSLAWFFFGFILVFQSFLPGM